MVFPNSLKRIVPISIKQFVKRFLLRDPRYIPRTICRRIHWLLLPWLQHRYNYRRILLVVHSPMMGIYVRNFYKLFLQDDRLSFFVTIVPAKMDETSIDNLLHRIRLPCVDFERATTNWWDLIVSPCHGYVDRFPSEVPKFFINHGIYSGKIIGENDFCYGPRYTMVGEVPRYNRMFESSLVARDLVTARYPALQGHISVVGDLRIDAMLVNQVEREKIRASLGFSSHDIVVLSMSTWGSSSLMERFGPAYCEEAKRLMDAGKYKFIISTHPNLWIKRYAVRQPWGAYLINQKSRGFVVIEPSDDWERYLIASDLAVSDHTSLSLTYATLGKPLVYVPIEQSESPENSMISRLVKISPRLEAPDQLEHIVQSALREYPLDKLKHIALDICAYPGQSANRIRQETYQVLNLAAPASEGS